MTDIGRGNRAEVVDNGDAERAQLANAAELIDTAPGWDCRAFQELVTSINESWVTNLGHS